MLTLLVVVFFAIVVVDSLFPTKFMCQTTGQGRRAPLELEPMHPLAMRVVASPQLSELVQVGLPLTDCTAGNAQRGPLNIQHIFVSEWGQLVTACGVTSCGAILRLPQR
jgi:hypothetical protein